MADKTKIEWTDATWNPIRGCSRVSEGCRHCYAESVAARFSGPGMPYEGLAAHVTRSDGTREARWTGEVRLVEEHLLDPLRWRRPRRVFVNSMSDLFHEKVPDAWIDRIFAVMALAPQHTFQILTKRPERMKAWYSRARARPAIVECVAELYVEHPFLALRWPFDQERAIAVGTAPWPLPNVWLGVSAEDQATAEERIPILLETPAAVRFVSLEPLLGAIYLVALVRLGPFDDVTDALAGERWFATPEEPTTSTAKLDWVIVGGESGHGARPMRAAWARSLRDQCVAYDVPFFFKQWGEYLPTSDANGPYMMNVGKKHAGRWLDDRTWDQFPFSPSPQRGEGRGEGGPTPDKRGAP